MPDTIDYHFRARGQAQYDFLSDLTSPNAIFVAGWGSGKALALNTPLPTPTGWTSMGAVRVGDTVMDERGEPTKVTAVYETFAEEAWRLEFSDRTAIEACADHQWTTFDVPATKAWARSVAGAAPRDYPDDWPTWRSKGGKGAEVRSTREVVDSLTHPSQGTNHRIPVAAPLQLPKVDTLVDPYTLGFWLGDGTAGTAQVTIAHKDADEVIEIFAKAGYPSRLQPSTVKEDYNCAGYLVGQATSGRDSLGHFTHAGGLRIALRGLGVLRDKQIPSEYLRASHSQRLDLLRGLMDSDGYIGSHWAEFCNTSKKLADGVLELVRTLGERPVMYHGRATLDGKDCGPKYRVVWRPNACPFRLSRKVQAYKDGLTIAQHIRSRHRKIVHAERIEPQTMRCITVDSPNSLYLAGEGMIPTHNTYCGAAKACYRAMLNKGNGILGGQHYRHLKQVMVGAILDQADAMGLKPKWLGTDKILLFQALPRNNIYGCQFMHGLSADAPDAIRAVEGTFAWYDEAGAYTASATDATRDALLQFAGRVRGTDVAPGRDWTGTNEGDGTSFYQMQIDAANGERDDITVYRGKSIDNLEHLGQPFFDHVNASIPPELIDQYLNGGVGQLAQEVAAWEWKDTMVTDKTVDPTRPLITCWDFGVAPMAMSVAQQAYDDGPVHWHDEIVIPLKGNTEDACRQFCERWAPQHPGPILIFGDASGKAGSAQSKANNYQQMFGIMESYWTTPGAIVSYVPQANPGIESRLVAANAAIRAGMASVSPKCKNLLRDLTGCKLLQTRSGKAEDQRNGYSHSWVGMAYTLCQLFPIMNKHQVRGGAEGKMATTDNPAAGRPSPLFASRFKI